MLGAELTHTLLSLGEKSSQQPHTIHSLYTIPRSESTMVPQHPKLEQKFVDHDKKKTQRKSNSHFMHFIRLVFCYATAELLTKYLCKRLIFHHDNENYCISPEKLLVARLV